MPKSKCPHNRQKYFCKECGGKGICLHNRQKSTCKECGGGSICPHNRIKSQCKECKADKDDSMPADIEEFSLIEVEAAKILTNL